MRHQFLATLAAALGATSAVAASPMDLSVIDRAVADFTGSEVGQPGGAKLPVDRRLRLSSCQSPLDLQWFGRDQRSVQVACPSAGWRIYVAVDGGAGGAGRFAQQYGEALVKRGENVTILFRGKGFTLTRQGSAVEDGAQGEWIKVRAAGERTETLRAVVIRPGQVGIDLP
ncbi:MAG: flagella basal body P-ring formation protein FlgA [Erythrobacter sp.]